MVLKLMLTPKQCRMACAGLGWTAKDLAGEAGVRQATITHFMKGGECKSGTLAKIEKAIFDTARVEFVSLHCVCVQPHNNVVDNNE